VTPKATARLTISPLHADPARSNGRIHRYEDRLLRTGRRTADRRNSTQVCRYLLRLSDDEPHDTPAYLSLIHNCTAVRRSASLTGSSCG